MAKILLNIPHIDEVRASTRDGLYVVMGASWPKEDRRKKLQIIGINCSLSIDEIRMLMDAGATNGDVSKLEIVDKDIPRLVKRIYLSYTFDLSPEFEDAYEVDKIPTIFREGHAFQ
jgi:hypothetical protein